MNWRVTNVSVSPKVISLSCTVDDGLHPAPYDRGCNVSDTALFTTCYIAEANTC